jgi:Tfp pilus assembly protein PilO
VKTSNSKASSLILLTALLGLVILLAAYFFLINPVMSNASEANTNAAAQEETNANTQIEVNKLKEQYDQIDEYQAELAALQVQIPTAPMYPDLQRMFADIAQRHHVVITSLTFGVATPYQAASTSAATDDGTGTAAAPTPAPSATPSAGTDGTDGNTANGPAPVVGQYGIPVSVTVAGKYDNVMATLNELQTGTGRLVLINNIVMTKGADLTSSDGTAGAIPKDADTTGVLSGFTFVLTSSTPTEEATGDTGTGTSASPSPSAPAASTSPSTSASS